MFLLWWRSQSTASVSTTAAHQSSPEVGQLRESHPESSAIGHTAVIHSESGFNPLTIAGQEVVTMACHALTKPGTAKERSPYAFPSPRITNTTYTNISL